MQPAPMASSGAHRSLKRSCRLAMACAAALLMAACANQAPAPETSLWQFTEGGFQPAQGYATSSPGFAAWSPGESDNIASDDTGYSGANAGSPEAGPRWDTGVAHEPTYAYRGGRDPRTGLASGQM